AVVITADATVVVQGPLAPLAAGFATNDFLAIAGVGQVADVAAGAEDGPVGPLVGDGVGVVQDVPDVDAGLPVVEAAHDDGFVTLEDGDLVDVRDAVAIPRGGLDLDLGAIGQVDGQVLLELAMIAVAGGE